MYTGLLKQFLKKMLAMGVSTACILTFTLNIAYAAPPAGDLIIDAASWDEATATLIANGVAAVKPQHGGGPVEIFDADSANPVLLLGEAVLPNSGKWTFAGSICADNIYATQDGHTSDVVAVEPGCNGGGGNTPPTANNDSYNATIDVALNVELSSPGVLGNDTDDGLTAPLVVSNLVNDVTHGTLNLNVDGSFDYTPNPGFFGADTFIYEASDGEFQSTATVTITVVDLPPRVFADQTDFKILMNYELGMHCTGFEFAYCCVLPAYNSILAQVVKPDSTGQGFPELMEGDPNVGRDALGRETVVRDRAQDGNGNFKKYVLKYWHDAQPRNDGRGKIQTSTLISAAEGNSLMSWNTIFDSAALNADGSFVVSDAANPYNGAEGVILGDGDLNDPTDNYQNAVWNHLYFYENLEGGNSTGTSLEDDKIRLGVSGQTNPPGFPSDIAYPTDCGPAFHPLGPVTTDPNDPTLTIDNTCGGFSNGNVLTFSGHTGTVVFTQMKVLENLPIMLTSPDIWEALGLPLTPFEDSIDFFTDPGLLNEDSVRPFVVMNAQMYDYDSNLVGPNNPSGAGNATLDSAENPIIGFGTAPIDIPNCERCHSNGPTGSFVDIPASESAGVIDADPNTQGVQLEVINSPNTFDQLAWANTQQEYEFWNAYYNIDKSAGDSDWYSRLKSAALSMLTGHDTQHGTSFTANYPGCNDSNNPSSDCGALPQNTRLGHESVICQRCHADNVIASVKSATFDDDGVPTTPNVLIKPITEAIHNNHRGINMADANGDGGVIIFADSLGRDGGCQGCHPAHRSNGDMDGYPITLAGGNRYAASDNRGANGGCFVGRDVHSNPGKDSDGVETPAHMNAVGQHLVDNVANDGMGIWCTNCHNQLGQEIWKAENMVSLVHGVPGKEADGVTDAVNIRALPDLAAIAAAVGTSTAQAESWLDPTEGGLPGDDDSYAIWATDPGLCDYVASVAGPQPFNPAHDGNVGVVEVLIGGSLGGGGSCTNSADGNAHIVPVDCGFVTFDICGSTDDDGDFSVNLVGNSMPDAGGFGGAFCTTPDCVASAQASLGACTLAAGDNCAVPVPMSAATDGRDHWLSPGEPHCADCHAAPFVEQSGNINAYPPFNYPRKASLMRYSRGHQDISCQGCHESIHGLYPVTPNIDTTTYAQAAALNHDGSHGPLKCGTCHDVDGQGIPTFMDVGGGNVYDITDYDSAVAWAHEYTEEQSVLNTTCQNCHGVNGDDDAPPNPNSVPADWSDVSITNETYMKHASRDDGKEPRGSRQMMDKAEMEVNGGSVFMNAGSNPTQDNGNGGICEACHGKEGGKVSCDDGDWLDHLTMGRVSAPVFEKVSEFRNGGVSCW